MTETDSLFPTHHLMRFPGFVAMKARTTVMVLANTQDTAIEKTTPKTACRRRHVTVPGHPRKRKEQRKHSRSEKSKAQVICQLLALTMGVFWWRINVPITTIVITAKETAKLVRISPRDSL